MRDTGAVAGPVPQVVSYLRGVTRGWRTLGSIAGVVGGVWGKRRAGRAVPWLKCCTDSTIPTLLPGPIWSECRLGEPMLSWFVLPGPCRAGDPIEQAVQALLASVDSPGISPELPDLMARMVAAHADLARNATPVYPPELTQPRSKPRVLLIDQRCGGGATQAVFIRMMAAARSEHPGVEIWIWPTARGAAGGLSDTGELPIGTRKIVAGLSFFATLPHVDHTYTVSTPEGAQALLAGIPVHVFGRPYYAGWGLTTDDLPMPDHHYRPILAALFDAVCLRFARYLDPETRSVGTLERSLDNIELQRTVRARYADCKRAAGVRFQLWK